MSIFKLIAVFITSFSGSMLQAMCGFGIGVINVCALPHLFSVSFSMMLSVILGATSSLFICLRLRKHVLLKPVLLPLCGYVLTCTPAIFFASKIENKSLSRIVGIFLIILGIWYFISKSKKRIKPTPLKGVLIGLLSGILAGFFASGGPPMAIYYTSLDLEKEQYVATTQCYFALSVSYSVICRALSGAFIAEIIPYAAIGIAAIFIGSWCGVRLLVKTKVENIKKFVYSFVILSGAAMVFK